jgi:hypothetical protein
VARRLAFPALLIAINLGCSFTAFKAGDYKKAVYWLSSTVCLAMVSL